MPKKNKKDRYIIRKYVFASSAAEAIKEDKKTPPMDIWVDDDWKKDNNDFPKADSIGFETKDNVKS